MQNAVSKPTVSKNFPSETSVPCLPLPSGAQVQIKRRGFPPPAAARGAKFASVAFPCLDCAPAECPRQSSARRGRGPGRLLLALRANSPSRAPRRRSVFSRRGAQCAPAGGHMGPPLRILTNGVDGRKHLIRHGLRPCHLPLKGKSGKAHP